MSDAVLTCMIEYGTDCEDRGPEMRRPRDIDAELKALQEKAKQLKAQRTIQLGELVEATGADTLSIEALAGVLLAAVEQADGKPEAVARWTERGTAFFQAGGKKGSRKGTGNDQNGTAGA
ncbi:conjugal transfer protein TraD (plasmid) [Komagataeibacter nataicola]|uniref:conjugal transfer protein TraD n=1 Tax=Komagataeibacter nataicola TaxID=265960 RepID=UPI0023DD0FD6|nr:conjugal transfer protein TraD [Komagataeibacter nataicola]WEQ54377.1 conjugal transfer protein TraD [Komagataeibacter nataicola]